jgi:hypothetical protein
MTPILGIIASANQGQFISYTDYVSIATTTVGSGGAATITFSSIPSTYQHLQIRAFGKSTSTGDSVRITFNSDTGSNYANHFLYGNSAAASSSAETSGARINVYAFYAPSTTANVFGSTILDILDYKNTDKYKTTRSLGGFDQNGSGSLGVQSGLWMSTSAITSITFAPQAGNWAEYSSFALYGIKG